MTELKEDGYHLTMEKTINIKVPAGVESGNYLTVEGQGNENIQGSPGD